MKRILALSLLMAMTALGTEIPSSDAVNGSKSVTFNKDVLPILQNNCQACHRQGGISPMALTTYEGTRPFAKAIKTAVLNKKMPPWFADPHVGDFRNAPKMTEQDIKTLVAWADEGAKEGKAEDRPAQSPKWTDGWQIQPDVVVSMPEPFPIPARGVGEVREFFVPNPFKEDTWVSAIEIRPGNPSVVHHVIVQVADRTQRGFVFKELVRTCADCSATVVAETAAKIENLSAAATAVLAAGRNVTINGNLVPNGSYSNALTRVREMQTGRGAFTTMEAIYAPGSQPLDFRYDGSAKLIRAGQPIRIEMHYPPNGKETTDQTSVGFTLAKEPARSRFVIMAPEHLADTRHFIPADNSNYETRGELTFEQDAKLAWFMPHMHLRGKDMTFQLIFPDGSEETVLSARFNFHWQLGYELREPIDIPKGTRMNVTAHHDNSAANPNNPTPGQAATWGEMTSQEMMLPWFGVIVDRDAEPDAIARYRPPDLGPAQVAPNGQATFQNLLLRQ